jgi:hypothetical protein
MRPLVTLIGACLASLVAYGLVFGFLIHKPLTVGVIDEILRLKENYATRAGSPKLIIFAGSNARFSHRCQTIEPLLSLPCVNFGVGRGIGLDYLFGRLEPLLGPGDIVYMPLEYEWYVDDKVAAMTGPDAELMLYDEKEKLLGLGAERALRAFFSFDLPYAVAGLSEMALQAIGVQRRVGLATMTRQGDETGHTPEKAVPYRAYVQSVNPYIPTAATLATPSYAERQVTDFLVRSKQRGVLVIGGLQTTFRDAPVTDETIAALRHLYEASGQRFLVLGSHSQYSRDCFYDTYAHLTEPCQIAHSTALAAALAPIIGEARGAR